MPRTKRTPEAIALKASQYPEGFALIDWGNGEFGVLVYNNEAEAWEVKLSKTGSPLSVSKSKALLFIEILSE